MGLMFAGGGGEVTHSRIVSIYVGTDLIAHYELGQQVKWHGFEPLLPSISVMFLVLSSNVLRISLLGHLGSDISRILNWFLMFAIALAASSSIDCLMDVMLSSNLF